MFVKTLETVNIVWLFEENSVLLRTNLIKKIKSQGLSVNFLTKRKTKGKRWP